MTDVKKMQFLTTSAWLRGYAETLDEDRYRSLIHKMNQAADLLCEVWDEYEVKLEAEKSEWVGLTDDEIVGMTCECIDDGTFNMNCARDFARAIETKLKEQKT